MNNTKSTLTLAKLWSSKWFKINVLVFVICNVLLCSWIVSAQSDIYFDKHTYLPEARHYARSTDQIGHNHFNLVHSLAAFDAEWYLRIADNGYPVPSSHNEWQVYAFPPLYPAAIAVIHVFLGSYFISAFVLTQALLLANFVGICWLVSRWYNKALAYKTAWLVFLWPMSVFYRTYYSEGLFLLLTLIFLESIRSSRWGRAAMSAGLLAVTRLVGVAAIIVLVWQLVLQKNRIRARKGVLYMVVACLPLFLFLLFCLVHAHNFLEFNEAQRQWPKVHTTFPGAPTLWAVTHFLSLPWHRYHVSRIDTLSIVVSGMLLVGSRKWLPKSWWQFSLVLWLIPILTNDTVSAARFQIVNFPLFLYAAHIIRRPLYFTVLVLSLVGLMVTLVLFVNWHWVG